MRGRARGYSCGFVFLCRTNENPECTVNREGGRKRREDDRLERGGEKRGGREEERGRGEERTR